MDNFHSLRRSLTSLLSITAMAGFLFVGTALAEKPKKAVFVAFSDFHGSLQPTMIKAKNGEEVPWGGAPYLASYLKILKERSAENDTPVFIIDAGDDFQGTIISNREEGKPVIKFFNYIGVDAAVLGNHDFDYGPVGVDKSVPLSPQDDPQGAIKERMKESRYPYLAANVFSEIDGLETSERPSWIKPSLMVEKMGVKVGIVGAAEEATPSTTEKRNLKGLAFKNAYNYVVEEAEKLREKGADFVVLSIHEGAICDGENGEGMVSEKSDENDIDACKGELVDLVKKLPDGAFDVVLGGHTHHSVQKKYNNMAVMEPFPKGRSLQWAEIAKTEEGSDIKLHGPERICGKGIYDRGRYNCTRYKLENATKPIEKVKFLGKIVEADEGVLKLLKKEFDETYKIETRVLSKAKVIKKLERSYNDESALGNFIADMIFAYYKEGSVDLAFTNNGGIRENLYVGPITYGELFEILPFENKMAITKLKGKTIKRYIEKGLSKQHSGIAWSGLTYESSAGKLLWAKVQGEDLDENKMYTVATADFLAMGGGGFDSVPLSAGEGMLPDSVGLTIRDALEVGLAKLTKDVVPTDYYNPKSPRQNIH